MMLTTQNITSRTPQGSYHIKYTNLCNEEKKANSSTPRYLITRPNLSQPKPWARDQGKGLQGCGPRKNPRNDISCSWECRRVWGNEPSHSQMSSHLGSWSLNGLLNFQKVIVRAKTQWIENFLILLESS
jgi:hypothetical protein